MRTAIGALINRPGVQAIGKLAVAVCGAALLSYLVIGIYQYQQNEHLRGLEHAALAEALRQARAERDVFESRIWELEKTVWGDLQPKVDEQQQKNTARVVVPVPVWRNREREILDRLNALETWRMRHMSIEHD